MICTPSSTPIRMGRRTRSGRSSTGSRQAECGRLAGGPEPTVRDHDRDRRGGLAAQVMLSRLRPRTNIEGPPPLRMVGLRPALLLVAGTGFEPATSGL